MMDSQPNFEYLCRVCAANTKGRNSVAECVYILKTPALKDKIEKYLYLTIGETDELPKVLCKTCFRQVEATASLSKIAKHTEKVFRDFLSFSAAASKPPQTDAINYSNDEDLNTTNTNEFTPLALVAKEVTPEKQPPLAHRVQHTPPPPAPGMISRLPQPHTPRRDEVVVNVSITDPLTRETAALKTNPSSAQKQQQMQRAMLNPSTIPKSIAQRGITPKQGEEMKNTALAASNSASAATAGAYKQQSPPAILNFMHNRAAVSERPLPAVPPLQTQQQVTSITSGGYVIGRVSGTNMPNAVVQQKRKNLKATLNNIKSNNPTGQVSLLKKSIVGVPKEVENKASSSSNKSVRISENQSDEAANLNPPAKETVTIVEQKVLQATPLVEGVAIPITIDDVNDLADAEEELPHQIIIAAAKKKKPIVSEESTQVLSTLPPVAVALPVADPAKVAPPKGKRRPRTTGVIERSYKHESVLICPAPSAEAIPAVSIPREIGGGATSIHPQSVSKPMLLPGNQQTAAPTPTPTPVQKSAFPEDILLGNVIKDVDLLKLILKALKWPVTPQTLEAQINCLRNSKFALIMSDSNLLQDTDLTQILGPYLAPVLMVAQAMQQQQQQQQLAAATAANAATSHPSSNQQQQPPQLPDEVPNMTYKLPAETSVQLIPASPPSSTELQNPSDLSKNASNNTLKKRSSAEDSTDSAATTLRQVPPKKQRRYASKSLNRAASEFSAIVISDEEDNNNEARNIRQPSKSSPNVTQVEIDSSFLSQIGLVSPNDKDSSNEALLALLQRQKAALTRLEKSKKRRQGSKSDIIVVPANGSDDLEAFDTDDIVLMEGQGQTCEESVSGAEVPSTADETSISSHAMTTSTDTSASSVTSVGEGHFNIPENISKPLITRPIIKRRKTVIQASPARTSLNICNSDNVTSESSSCSSAVTVHTIATQVPSSLHSIATQVPSVINKDLTDIANEPQTTMSKTSAVPIPGNTSQQQQQAQLQAPPNKKSPTSKSALGQQLLEAIGLQQVLSTQSSSDEGKARPMQMGSNKESIQQIRSALKRSLKQAQEQRNQRKASSPIRQDADSTTKSVVKEVVLAGKAKQSANNANSSLNVDVEDQIDKIALVVQKPRDRDTKLYASPRAIDEGKAEKNKQQPTELPTQGGQRKSTAGHRRRKSASYVVEKVTSELKPIAELTEESETKLRDSSKQRYQKGKNDDLDEESQKATHLTSETVSSSDNAKTLEDTVSPRRRGRKRIVEEKPMVESNKRENVEETTTSSRERRNGRASPSLKRIVMDNDEGGGNDSDAPSERGGGTNSRSTRASKNQGRISKNAESPVERPRRSTTARVTRNNRS